MTHSLRLRLLLIWALAIVFALGAAGVVLTALFSQHLERAAVRRMTDDLNRLAALLDADAPQLGLSQPMSDPRFDVPYGGVYWQVRDPATGVVTRSRSMWDTTLAPVDPPVALNETAERRVLDPEGAPALAVTRRLSFELDDGTTRTLELSVAEDNEATDTAIAAYRIDLFRALALLAIILVLAAWAQVTLGLAPLRAIRRGITAIRMGEARRLEGSFPSEVQPLVAEVNELTEAQEMTIQFARERSADLAHGLKGRLQALNAEAHDLRLKGEDASAVAIERLTADMASTIDHQLGLSRLRRRSPHLMGGTDLGECLEKIVRTLQKTERGGELEWRVDLPAGTSVNLDRSDLSELLGALVENAAKWANARVEVAGRLEGGSCVITVDDDGPGISDAQIEKLGQRGVRLDESRSGSGIGISIVREIVALNGGELGFSRSRLGGLAATVRLRAGTGTHGLAAAR